MTTTLKPCLNPWCHSPHARVVAAHLGDGFCVFCKKCGARSPWFTTQEKAIEIWNNRPGEKAVAEECAKMADELAEAIETSWCSDPDYGRKTAFEEIATKIRSRFGEKA